MKQFLILSALIFTVGCTPENNTPGTTIVGATIGGLAGGILGNGSPVGIALGAAVGGAGGYMVGRTMDNNDRAYAEQQVEEIPDGRTVIWTDSRGAVYRLTPSPWYYHADAYCRDYTARTYRNGRVITTYGRVCHQPTHTWIIQ